MPKSHIMFIFAVAAISVPNLMAGDVTDDNWANSFPTIKHVKGVLVTPPKYFSDSSTTDAALIGNGDLLGAVGGPSEKLLFWLSKLDFWEARENPNEKGGARTIGPLVLDIPQSK